MVKIVVAFLSVALTATGAVAGGLGGQTQDAPVDTTAVAAPQSTDWTGFYAGLSAGAGKVKVDATADDEVESFSFKSLGLQAGYMYDMGNVVVGGELDYSRITVRDIESADRMVRLRARVGYDAGRFQPYLTAGVARLTGGDGQTGKTFGIGGDYLVNDHVMVGLEFNSNKFSETINDEAYDFKFNQTELNVSYRF